MSQSNTPNSTPYVKPGSVPQCLRHTMPCVPLEEAAWIAEFLGAACVLNCLSSTQFEPS